MRQYGDMAPGNFTIEGQVVAGATVEALTRACAIHNPPTRQDLVDAVESFKDVQNDVGLPGISFTLSKTDHYSVETMRLLRATVVGGQGKWEYFGDLISFK